MKTLLKGGTIVSSGGSRRADLLIEGETIAAVAPAIDPDGCEVVHVEGKLLFLALLTHTPTLIWMSATRQRQTISVPARKVQSAAGRPQLLTLPARTRENRFNTA